MVCNLTEPIKLSHLRVCQCFVFAAYRASNFYVWLSNTRPVVGQQLQAATLVSCGQYEGKVPASSAAYLTCNSSPATQLAYKYVIVQSSVATPDAICIAELEVYSG